ncbi:MAG: 4-hydroxy-3-methylbut-2-enyl diphosphate reductase [Bacteroidales bacterium]|nr:4-hydroxy-3-methylbut-2-enyl diphosphate reductase [Bacteroidales bacterium]
MKITIDPDSGFCFGVVRAVDIAEKELDSDGFLYCLGDIVHNGLELNRLQKKGLEVIEHNDLKRLKNCKVLIRAHGEPPATYKIALQNNIELIDASCPVVLKLQKTISIAFEEMKEKDGQIIIYGREGHPEVNGLVGQTNNKAIVINSHQDLEKINYLKPIRMFSQTTKSTEEYQDMINNIKDRLHEIESDSNATNDFISYNTICSKVSRRVPHLRKFAKQHDIIIFVSGKKSSNGMFLYSICKSVNQNTYLVSEISDLKKQWFKKNKSIGISGATSTPMWLMEKVKNVIKNF